jgi:hypothetical protein
MIRNLKVLLVAAMAVAAFTAVNASGAQAAEEFHCSVEPCRYRLHPDEVAGTKTAHHVFIVKNSKGESVSFTCNTLDGEGRSLTKTATELTVQNLQYTECLANPGGKVNVRMNECDYDFAALGGAVGSSPGARVEIRCPGTKHIEIEIEPEHCVFEVTPQDLKGVHYHNIGTAGTSSTEVTVEANVPGIVVEKGLNAGTKCGIPTGSLTLTSEYTTGNTIVTAEEDIEGSPAMVEGWWK